MKVMHQFHNTKATAPQRSEVFLEGGLIKDKQLESSVKFDGDMMVTTMEGRKGSQKRPQSVLLLVPVEEEVRIALLYLRSLRQCKSIPVPLRYDTIF